MTDANASPLPVTGFESLVWREATVQIPVDGRNHRPELVVRGADVGLAFAGGPFGNELSSLTIEQPFAEWPPRVGAPAIHTTRDLVHYFEVVPWLGDELIFSLEEPFAVRCGHAGSRSLGINVTQRDNLGRPTGAWMGSAKPYVGANPADGVYLVGGRCDSREGPITYYLEHRSAERLDVAQQLGELPEWPELCAVLDDGSFLFALLHVPPGAKVRKGWEPSRDPSIFCEVELFRTNEGKVESCGRLRSPPKSHATAIFSAKGGGAWIMFYGGGIQAVVRVDTLGRAVGEPWHVPFGSGGCHRLARWRDGFILVMERSSVAILASDGTRTTRSASSGIGDRNTYDHFAAIASPDGCSILVARSLRGHIQLLRADFLAAALPSNKLDHRPTDVWAEDREVAARRGVQPPRAPGTPIETSQDGTPPRQSHAMDRIVSQVRLRHVLRTISGLHYGEFSQLRCSAGVGTFFDDDGSGNFVLFSWSQDGLISIGFDHDNNPEAGVDESELTPEQHFPDLPQILRPLLDDALRRVSRLATGGLWVTSGDHARFQASGEFPEDFSRFMMLPEPSILEGDDEHSWRELLGLSEPQVRLAVTLAADSAGGIRAISAEEEAILMARPSVDSEPSPRHILAAARSFSSASIEWSSSEERSRSEPAAGKVAAQIARRRG